MPKVKKIRSAALASQSVRHEPLGQVIQDDANRDKYAANRQQRRSKGRDEDNVNEDGNNLLDEKTSARILKLSKMQRLEVDGEEERRRAQARNNGAETMPDSDDEDFPEEEGFLEGDYDGE